MIKTSSAANLPRFTKSGTLPDDLRTKEGELLLRNKSLQAELEVASMEATLARKEVKILRSQLEQIEDIWKRRLDDSVKLYELRLEDLSQRLNGSLMPSLTAGRATGAPVKSVLKNVLTEIQINTANIAAKLGIVERQASKSSVSATPTMSRSVSHHSLTVIPEIEPSVIQHDSFKEVVAVPIEEDGKYLIPSPAKEKKSPSNRSSAASSVVTFSERSDSVSRASSPEETSPTEKILPSAPAEVEDWKQDFLNILDNLTK